MILLVFLLVDVVRPMVRSTWLYMWRVWRAVVDWAELWPGQGGRLHSREIITIFGGEVISDQSLRWWEVIS